MKKALFLPLSFLLLISCNSVINPMSSNSISGNNNIISADRPVSEFSSIQNSGSIDVVIIPGDKYEVSAEDDENLLPHLITEVKGNVLSIHYDENYNINDSHGKVTVKVPSLSKISSSGSGDIAINGLLKCLDGLEIRLSGSGDLKGEVDAPSVTLSGSGSGDIKLAGNTKDFVCNMSGSGDAMCNDLKSENAVIKIGGSSDVSIFASVSLKVNIAGSGDVIYSGNPSLPEVKIAGSGTVKKRS